MGVRVPVMRKTARAVFERYPPVCADNWRATILALWREATYREQRYAAVELAVHRPFLRWLNMDSVPLLDEIIVDGAWWDYVDRIAPAGLGRVLSTEPKPMSSVVRGWARDENICGAAPRSCASWASRKTPIRRCYTTVSGLAWATGSSSCRRRWVGRFATMGGPTRAKSSAMSQRTVLLSRGSPQGSPEKPGVSTECGGDTPVAVVAVEVSPIVDPTPAAKAQPKVIIGGEKARIAIAPSGAVTARTNGSPHRCRQDGWPRAVTHPRLAQLRTARVVHLPCGIKDSGMRLWSVHPKRPDSRGLVRCGGRVRSPWNARQAQHGARAGRKYPWCGAVR